MRTVEARLRASLAAAVLLGWVEQRWISPYGFRGRRLLFDEAERARARLIGELKQDLSIDDEAMPVVLQLLDQVYALRKALGDLTRAIKACPKSVQQAIAEQLKES